VEGVGSGLKGGGEWCHRDPKVSAAPRRKRKKLGGQDRPVGLWRKRKVRRLRSGKEMGDRLG